MSYRAFKRLLGETSLERKCRFLFGAGILVLITLSFWLYAYQTEHLAYRQAVLSCRLLVNPVLAQHHVPHLETKLGQKLDGKALQAALNLTSLAPLKDVGKEYQYHFLTDKDFEDSYERDLFKEFFKANEKQEDSRVLANQQVMLYYAPIRAGKACLVCHQAAAENDLLAMVRIRMPTKGIEEGVHWNRAILMATALGTALLIMTGSWIIVRYIIVKPVKHLKEVSDAISAGELNVRSEIQTGDEFEDLSHAFNRMLRNLVSMQDQWRKVNADLDHKVDELAQANMALYESNRLKADFLATMSHELRTPLNTVLGFSDVLLSSDGLSDKQQRWVENIQSSGRKLLALINDILDLAKIEAGKMHVRIEEFSLQDVCDSMLSMFRPLAEKKHIDLRGHVDPDIPALRQDVTKLQQILQNLLSNAIKFTPEGGWVELKAEADARHVLLTIRDTGVGIALEEQDLVFQKFRQSGNPLTREHEGTGLGLSIVRELTKLLGGDIVLSSELGRGSTFTVRLPWQLSEEPRLEFDLANERIDLSKAQKVDVRLYADKP
ncbi:MAG: ATP-binding protein [Gemmataceae bacterium]|nr:ATP-binding protein [Gemmataceae bacterium]MCI0742334.1 ATP-binding protein [Gemmataceae bacterium]